MALSLDEHHLAISTSNDFGKEHEFLILDLDEQNFIFRKKFNRVNTITDLLWLRSNQLGIATSSGEIIGLYDETLSDTGAFRQLAENDLKSRKRVPPEKMSLTNPNMDMGIIFCPGDKHTDTIGLPEEYYFETRTDEVIPVEKKPKYRRINPIDPQKPLIRELKLDKTARRSVM